FTTTVSGPRRTASPSSRASGPGPFLAADVRWLGAPALAGVRSRSTRVTGTIFAAWATGATTCSVNCAQSSSERYSSTTWKPSAPGPAASHRTLGGGRLGGEDRRRTPRGPAREVDGAARVLRQRCLSTSGQFDSARDDEMPTSCVATPP